MMISELEFQYMVMIHKHHYLHLFSQSVLRNFQRIIVVNNCMRNYTQKFYFRSFGKPFMTEVTIIRLATPMDSPNIAKNGGKREYSTFLDLNIYTLS